MHIVKQLQKVVGNIFVSNLVFNSYEFPLGLCLILSRVRGICTVLKVGDIVAVPLMAFVEGGSAELLSLKVSDFEWKQSE